MKAAVKAPRPAAKSSAAKSVKATGSKELGSSNEPVGTNPAVKNVGGKPGTSKHSPSPHWGSDSPDHSVDTDHGASGETKKLEAGAPEGIDPAIVRQIADLLNGTDLTEIEVQKGDLRIRVARAAPALGTASRAGSAASPVGVVATPPVEAAASEHPGTIKSPMVGTAYRRPSPEAKAFVEIGTQVKSGEKILLIEAMKTFNEILAPRAGTVTAILVEDNQPVEYDQPLLIIE